MKEISMRYMLPRSTFFVRVAGRKVAVRITDDPRREDDPVVVAAPGMFRVVVEAADQASSVPGDLHAVEDASAPPGGKRALSRPSGERKATSKTSKTSPSGDNVDTQS